MAKISRRGFGQVEPNKLSGGVISGRIFAQLNTDDDMGDYIENGRFAKYYYVEGQGLGYDNRGIVTTDDTAPEAVKGLDKYEWCLIYNEESHFDEREESHKDFCMKKVDYIDGIMVPRLFGTDIGDIFTTNTFGATEGKNSKLTKAIMDYSVGNDVPDVEGPELEEGDTVSVGADGYLVKGAGVEGAPVFTVVKVYTMADGQPGVKLMRIQ